MRKIRAKAPSDALDMLAGKHCPSASARRALYIELNSIAPFLRAYIGNLAVEKDRKRGLAKVRTNALRLLTAVEELDEDAFEFAACALTAIRAPDRRDALQARKPLKELITALRNLTKMQPARLPPQDLKHRPEMLIASSVVHALNRADVKVVAADTGVAADCFREIAKRAGLAVSESPRYWINKAKRTPEI